MPVKRAPSRLPPIVAALLDPNAYPHDAQGIQLVQTHISYILLAGDYAYKIKKPVDLGFVDYSTLDRRRHFCDEEIRLNRRLCTGVYLDTVPITRRAGRVRIGGAGEPVEYAVRMRRVPHGRTMPALLESGALRPEDVRRIAGVIASFHEQAERGDAIAVYGGAEAMRRNVDENLEQTLPYIGRTVTREQFDLLERYGDQFLRDNGALIDGRAAGGRVVDGHGDLRCDSVVIGEDGDVCIMDCIEFNERLRCGDVAADLGFLAMDLEYRGRRGLADELRGAYLRASGDETLPLVLRFYQCYRAYVRAKVNSMLANDEHVEPRARLRAGTEARRHFALAASYAYERHQQALVVIAGLSGVGKSYIADALAARLGAVILSTDRLRRAGSAAADRCSGYDSGLYAPESRSLVYEAMRARAAEYLNDRRSVVLDATHRSREDRRQALGLARNAGVTPLVVEVVASEDAVRDHFEKRASESSTISDARWATYREQRSRFDPIDEIAVEEHVTMDGAAPLTENIDSILARLASQQ